MPFQSFSFGCAVAAAVLVVNVGAQPAFAQDQMATVLINENTGFPGVCAAPCYVVEKTADVFLAGNPAAPGVCAAAEITYVYTLTQLVSGDGGGTIPSPGIPITEFEASVPFDLVASAGFIPGAGIAPTSTVVSPLNVVSWAFPDASSCPECLNQGQTSEQLFICSTASPGTRPDNVSTTAIILDAPGQCIVPLRAAGGPRPCSIGFWRNHHDDAPYNTLADTAAALSEGVFATGADLLAALDVFGNAMTITESADRQLAATLLNLAAGDLLDPAVTQCQLFEDNQIDANACGVAPLSIGDAVSESITKLLPPPSTGGGGKKGGGKKSRTDSDGAKESAKDCLDEINNGIGVIGAIIE